MRRSNPLFPSRAAYAARLRPLAVAFAAFRRGNPGRRRVPAGLRGQVVAALNAGVPAGTIERACGLSGSQVTRWRAAAARSAPPAPPALASVASAQVLSVVDTGARSSVELDPGIEIRVGSWCVRLSRSAD
jgi:hypothetical protein